MNASIAKVLGLGIAPELLVRQVPAITDVSQLDRTGKERLFTVYIL